MKIAVIIPTYNAAVTISLLLDSIQQQSIKPDFLLVIDSSSSDNTTEILKKYGVQYYTIKRIDFNHGTTRKYATSLVDADLYIFMTQDVALVNEHAFANLITAFADEKIGCAYGRQLPNKNANLLAAHLRLFAYPKTSIIKCYEDRDKLGIRTCFNSDNFAAYRKKALNDIRGLPENVILSEDMYAAAKMLINGWQIAYQADAMIYHSHNYTISEEFKRYFDIGVFHAMNPWILKTFECSKGEFMEYLKSAIVYCINQQAYLSSIKVVVNALITALGFYAGKHHKLIPLFVRKRMRMYSK